MFRPYRPQTRLLLLPALIALTLGGCATREYVDTEFGGVHRRVEALEALMNQATKTLSAHSERLAASDTRMSAAEQSASALSKRIEQTGTALAAVDQRLQGVDARTEATGKRLDAQQAEQGRTAKAVEDLNLRVRGLSDGLTNTQRQVEGGAANLTATQSRLSALESGLSAQAEAARAQAAAETARAAADKAAAASAAAQDASGKAAAVAVQAAMPVAPVQAAAVAAPVQIAVVPPADVNKRLEHMAELIGEVHKRIDVNSGTLSNTAVRVGKLEECMVAADKRDTEQDVAIRAAGDRMLVSASKLSTVEQRLTEQGAFVAKVGKQLQSLDASLGSARTQLEAEATALARAGQRIVSLESAAKNHEERLTKAEQEHSQLSMSAREALDRAVTAGRLAEGKLVMESVLTEDVSGFRVYRAQLSEAARQSLDEFAARLKQENKNIYVEVQGHTDSSGSAKVNHKLSRQRAEAVQEYLTKVAGLPVHRVGVVAYGATRPLADNDTPEGRAKNRRVDLVVLK
ncbi:MAG: OmpA family protein [Betaproteobacteria bacterium]|nr:OmpA family protein [Betaproteobacteria bacterium]